MTAQMAATTRSVDLSERATSLREYTRVELLTVSFLAHLSSVPKVDAFALWLLTACAAILALVISNLDTVAPFINIEVLRLSGILFIFGALNCVVAKALAIWLEGQLEAIQNVHARVKEIMIEHAALAEEIQGEASKQGFTLTTLPDLNSVTAELSASLGPAAEWFARRGAEKSKEDPLYGLKILLKISRMQKLLITFEVLLLGGFLCSLVLGIKAP